MRAVDRWRWVILLLGNAAAVAGFWGAGSAEGNVGVVGVLAIPLYWVAAYLTGAWALPWPAIALAAGVALGGQTGTNDNEYAWMNYAMGLVLCQAAVLTGCVQRWRELRKRLVGAFPERPG